MEKASDLLIVNKRAGCHKRYSDGEALFCSLKVIICAYKRFPAELGCLKCIWKVRIEIR